MIILTRVNTAGLGHCFQAFRPRGCRRGYRLSKWRLQSAQHVPLNRDPGPELDTLFRILFIRSV